MPRPLRPVDLSFWFRHEVTVERYTGSGAYGDVFAAPTTEAALIDDVERFVRNAEGQQVVSSTTVELPSVTADVPAKSRVTLPAVFGSRVSYVVTVSRHDDGGMAVPDFLELALL